MSDRPNGEVPIPADLTAAWRTYLRASGRLGATVVEVALPSGMAVRARRPSLLDLMGAGRIPDALAARVEGLIAQAQEAGGEALATALDAQRQTDPAGFYALYLTLLDVCWVEAVVEPRFTRDPEADPEAIPVAAVAIPDKQYLFAWCQGVSDAVASFPDGTAGAVSAVGVGPAGDPLRPGPGGAAGAGPED